MTFIRHATATVLLGAAMGLAPPVYAEPRCYPGACPSTDVDFANQLHSYGIYGPRDYNAWIGKITCKRLYTGVDADAVASHKFVLAQLVRGSTDVQGWQFLGSAVATYCTEKAFVLEQISS